MMRYISTRGNYQSVTASQAIKLGMVPRGGLFVPETIPEIDIHDLNNAVRPDGKLSYHELAYRILKLYLGDYSEAELREFIANAYSPERFPVEQVAPLKGLDDRTAVLELWHGPTAAFKDMALQIMPWLLTAAMKKQHSGKEVVILVATSGDTGKAALEGFRDVPGTRVIVFYPKNGVSHVQEMQMITTEGKNTYAVGVNGNFDDCQTMVKQIFADPEMNRRLNDAGFEFSSANSINWGRLVPQIIYYFWAYLSMVDQKKVFIGDPVNFAVPTGNFGNILAGYYAFRMGLPVNRFICASNKNKVLTDFIDTGIYNRKRMFYRTISPSMDILISSNLERFLFEVTRHNPRKIVRWYEDLHQKGKFEVDDSTRQLIANHFTGGFATEEDTLAEIRRVYEEYGYLIDTHTAVGLCVNERYRLATGDETPCVVDSTASPYKFNLAVYSALEKNNRVTDEFEVMRLLHDKTGVPVHRAVDHLQDKKTHRYDPIEISNGPDMIFNLLGIDK